MSDSDEENEIRYGTPLEPYDEDEVPTKKKFQQTTEQYAVDAHGRRRFHGAFTGGYSAGHGGSVGTPDGFAPAVFRSSRSEKAKAASQRPEDFMDEEDRGEFGIAPRLMQTQSEFSGQKRPRQARFHDGPIPGEPVLEDLLRPVHETAAVRILKSMGWRPGQGAGDRVTRREKKKTRVYGCQMPGEESKDSSSDSEFEYEALFAPDDYDPCVLRLKSDRFGLGYVGLSRHSVLGALTGEYGSEPGTSRSHLVMRDKGKKISIRGQAFGVGALEEEDEDIYGMEDMSHYDFAIGGAPGQEKKKEIKRNTGVLQGFVASSKSLPAVPAHPPPALPRGYIPSGPQRSRFEPTSDTPRDQGLGRHELSAAARGALLGEVSLPKPAETTPVQKETPEDLIAKIVGRSVSFVTENKMAEENKMADETNMATATPKMADEYIPISKSNDANVFKPFASNPQKQARYDMFLRDKEGLLAQKDRAIDRLSEWERQREMVEFEQAAKLYRPLTGVMGDRFTHASQPDDQPTNPLAAVARSAASAPGTAEQRAAAARALYGALTRAAAEWRPPALLCRRFNVPDPWGDRPEQKEKDEKSKVSYSIFEYLESSVHNKESFTKEQTQFSGSKSVVDRNKPSDNKTSGTTANSTAKDGTKPVEEMVANKRMTVAELFLKESERDKQQNVVTETIEKFDRMELYKSIFLSDSEDEEPAKEASYKDFVDQPRNVERNPSPPKGIFANIDFEELNSWKKKEETVEETKKEEAKKEESNKAVKSSAEVDKETDLYGPKIPEHLKKRLEKEEATETFKPTFTSRSERTKKSEAIEISSSSSEDAWVEAKDKQKKKKSKKGKSKKKSKKKKNR